MSFKTSLWYGLTAGLLATICNYVYNYIYVEFALVDFSAIINLGSIAGTSFVSCLLGAFLFMFLERKWKFKALVIFNIITVFLAFVSAFGPLMMQLPYEIEAPELFPALAVPMHFITPLLLIAARPIFYR